jgi:hypothetical protein
MKLRLSILFLLLCGTIVTAQNKTDEQRLADSLTSNDDTVYTIHGTVLNEEGRALPYSSVYLSQSKKGTTTNSEGEFLLNIKTGSDILLVSHIGYETFSQRITPQTNTLQIRLKQFIVQIGEIIVTSHSAQDLLKSAIMQIPENYEQTPFLTKTYYRGKMSEKDSIIYLQEAAFDIIKSYQKGFKEIYYLVKNRNFRFDSDKIKYRGFGGQYDYVANAHKQFDNGFFRNYNISFLPATTFDNRQVHVLLAYPKKPDKKSFKMKIYIDAEDLAFVRFEYGIEDVVEIIAQYKKIGEKYFLMYGHQIYINRIAGIFGDRLIAKTLSAESDMITTGIVNTFSTKDIKGKQINNTNYLEKYTAQPEDTLFWKEHNRLLPDSAVSKAMRNN